MAAGSRADESPYCPDALAAARAVSRDEAAAEQQYDAWATNIWSGQVGEVIDELVGHGEHLGLPPSGGEKMLRLRAASLSDNKPLQRYFDRRSRGTRAYRHKP